MTDLFPEPDRPAAAAASEGSIPPAPGAAANGATSSGTTSSGITPSGATAFSDSPVRRRRPLFGTIFWGVVLLTFAAFMVVRTLFPVGLDPTLWLLGSVIVIGLLLVVAGIAAVARRAG